MYDKNKAALVVGVLVVLTIIIVAVVWRKNQHHHDDFNDPSGAWRYGGQSAAGWGSSSVAPPPDSSLNLWSASVYIPRLRRELDAQRRGLIPPVSLTSGKDFQENYVSLRKRKGRKWDPGADECPAWDYDTGKCKIPHASLTSGKNHKESCCGDREGFYCGGWDPDATVEANALIAATGSL